MYDFNDAKATLRTTILSQMISTMPPGSFDYLERAAEAAVEALLSSQTVWALKAIHDEVKPPVA